MKLLRNRVLQLLLAAAVAYAQQSARAPIAPEPGRIDIQIIDVETGYAIESAEVKWDLYTPGLAPDAEPSHSGPVSPDGRFVQRLPPGEYLFEISAPGYRIRRTHTNVAPAAVAPFIVNLDPVNPPSEFGEAFVQPKLREGFELIQGSISDAVTHRPMSGVRVTLEQSGASTTSGNDGYYELYAPAASTANLSRPEDFPKLDKLTAVKPGYKTYELTGLLYYPGSWSRASIKMTPGTGVMSNDVAPRALQTSNAPPQEPPSAEPTKIPQDLLEWLSYRPAHAEP